MGISNWKILLFLFFHLYISTINSELLRAPQQPLHDYAFTKFRPPPLLPKTLREPTFIQRITSWFFPWGMSTEEEGYNLHQAASKIDTNLPSPPSPLNIPQIRSNPMHMRDTEPTTARTTRATNSKCSPCNKIPWIPMMPTYQLPVVKGTQQQQQQVYFKHHFGNENPYTQVPPINGYNYNQPSSTVVPSTTPLKLIDGFQGHHTYGIPDTQNNLHNNYAAPSLQQPSINNFHNTYGTPLNYGTRGAYKYSSPLPAFPPQTTQRPNFNTIDTSVITFTTNKPNHNRPLRFTSSQHMITNPEYLPPPNILPLEGENNNLAPIPIPNLSPTPIPPLFDAKSFHDNPYANQKTGFIKLVPLEPVAQLSNDVKVQLKPSAKQLSQLKTTNNEFNNGIEVVNSNLVAEFTLRPDAQLNEREEINLSNHSINQQQEPLKINIDVGNNLEVNATLTSPIVVESVESATDSAAAGSEREYNHNAPQTLEVFDIDQLKDADYDAITEENNRLLPSSANAQEETTTERNYFVKFEPSIQTAADLAEEEMKKTKTNYFNYTDSTIIRITPITTKTTTTYSPPPFKPIEDFKKTLATLWTAATQPVSTTTASSYQTTSEPIKSAVSTKKPKQIQIVIPYTTYHKPSPFKPQEEQEIITYRPIRGHYVTHAPRLRQTSPALSTTTSASITLPPRTSTLDSHTDSHFNAHGSLIGYHNDQEYEQVQESQIVESKVTIEAPKYNRQLTKIVANNIRDLLKKEKTPKPPKIDIIKLQRNIDGWTEQSFLGKISTIMSMGHTKTIPNSFLARNQKTTSIMKIPTTTLAPKTTFDPDLMEDTKRQYENILYKNDEEPLYVKRHDRFLNRDNELLLINNNLTQNSIVDGVKVYAPKTTLSPKELWQRLHLTVSPLTNEKIYVVTPQPKNESNSTLNYKPRFAIRPTLASIRMNKRLSEEALKKMDVNDAGDLKKIEHSQAVRIITPERKDVTNSMDSATTEKSQNS